MIKIQKAKVEDSVQIKKLLWQTWNETYSEIFSPEQIETITSEWHSLDLLKKQIRYKNRLFLVASDNNVVVAMCNTGEIDGENIYIQRMHVLPGYQRQGIGSNLINEIIKHFPKCKSLDLEVEKHNAKAITFYLKNGFEKVGTKVFEVKSIKIPCFVMVKTL